MLIIVCATNSKIAQVRRWKCSKRKPWKPNISIHHIPHTVFWHCCCCKQIALVWMSVAASCFLPNLYLGKHFPSERGLRRSKEIDVVAWNRRHLHPRSDVVTVSVCWYICERGYAKTTELISTKLVEGRSPGLDGTPWIMVQMWIKGWIFIYMTYYILYWQ